MDSINGLNRLVSSKAQNIVDTLIKKKSNEINKIGRPVGEPYDATSTW
jgi:hypothetical protein